MPAPRSTVAEETRRRREGGRSQKLRLFMRGKAMSGQESMRGISQFPKPLIRTGMTRKKIMRNA